MLLNIIKRESSEACSRGIRVLYIVHWIHLRLQNSAGNLQLSSIFKAIMPQQRKIK